MFAQFKVDENGEKQWNVEEDKVPNWFLDYYSSKIKK